MTRESFVAIGIAGSTGLLLTAFWFQFFADLEPCLLCIWQRWPHAVAVALGLGYLATKFRLIPWLAVIAVLSGGAVAMYHTGVEQQWWKGLETCAGVSLSGLSGSSLLDISGTATVPRCDEIVWSFLGLSMASWNGLISLLLAGIWVKAATYSPAKFVNCR